MGFVLRYLLQLDWLNGPGEGQSVRKIRLNYYPVYCRLCRPVTTTRAALDHQGNWVRKLEETP